jgi:purine-binding chemotaxis protein CheW
MNGVVRTEGEGMMLCSLLVGGQSFGIDTRMIREVLGTRTVQRVPLAPGYIAGLVSYRGEVLTTVSLRALLGLPSRPTTVAGESCVLVLDGDVNWNGDAEQFGLMVDEVGGVVAVSEDLLRENPPAMSEVYRAVCCGAFRVPDGLIVQLDPEQLKPQRLATTVLLRVGKGITKAREGRLECER